MRRCVGFLSPLLLQDMLQTLSVNTNYNNYKITGTKKYPWLHHFALLTSKRYRLSNVVIDRGRRKIDVPVYNNPLTPHTTIKKQGFIFLVLIIVQT